VTASPYEVVSDSLDGREGNANHATGYGIRRIRTGRRGGFLAVYSCYDDFV
jgi:hypothetical protein